MSRSFHWFTGIIKVVDNFCNLRCRYCFFNGTNQSVPRRMSKDILEEIVKKFISYSDQLNSPVRFLWHGGEPLLAGLEPVMNF